MSAVIVIEIVLGIVVLAAAIRFAVRDTMQREANREREVGPKAQTKAEAAQPLSEVGSTESS